jgi:hypothetical protein
LCVPRSCFPKEGSAQVKSVCDKFAASEFKENPFFLCRQGTILIEIDQTARSSRASESRGILHTVVSNQNYWMNPVERRVSSNPLNTVRRKPGTDVKSCRPNSRKECNPMKEPGLDGRHRDKSAPKKGEIQQKRSDTLNKNLPKPIPEFSPNATLGTMRKETGKVSEEAVRRAAKRRG